MDIPAYVTGRKRDAIWDHFEKGLNSSKRQCCCLACGATFYADPKRMKHHILDLCDSVSEKVKATVLKQATVSSTTTQTTSTSNQPTVRIVSKQSHPKKLAGRTATAQSVVFLPSEVLTKHYDEQKKELFLIKGKGVFSTSIATGVMAAKKTNQLYPFCFSLPIDKCCIKIVPNVDEQRIDVFCHVKSSNKTSGLEVEAMTGASITALSLFNMCRDITEHISIGSTKLVQKTGGKREVVPGPNAGGTLMAN